MKRLIISLLALCLLPILSSAQTDDIRRPKSGMSLGMNPSLSGGGFAYLLRDDFSIAVAAGSVNGTAAVPGPGTRTVVDTNTKCSISSGKLQWASGVVANTDGLWESAITRILGKLVIGSITTGGENNYIGYIGTDVDQVTGPTEQSLLWDTGRVLTARNINSTWQVGLLDAVATTYNGAICLRTVGAYYLVKGGANYTKWSLLYRIDTRNTATIYPCLLPQSVAVSFDFIRIPNYLWTPTPLSADSFGGTWPTTDGGGLTGIEAGGSGKTWGEFLSGSGTTGAGVTWDHEWNFSNSLNDNPGTGKTAVNLTCQHGSAAYTTDWANRTNEAQAFDNNDYDTAAAAGSDIGNLGATYSIIVEFLLGDLGQWQTIASVGNDTSAANIAWWITTSDTAGLIRFSTATGGSFDHSNAVATGIVQANKHYQFVVSVSSNAASFYLNGVLMGTDTINTGQDGSAFKMAVGATGDGSTTLNNGSKVSRIATLKGTALTGDQVRAEYRKWVATSDAGVYARFYGGPDPGANGLTNQAGAVTEGTWGSENAGESSYQAYAIRYKPTVDSNPGNYDNSTSYLRRTGTWSIDTGTAVNAPVAGTEKVADGDMEAAGVANWADFNTPTTKEKNAVTPLAGTQDLHVIGDAAADGAQQTITGLTAQSWYRVSAMARTASGAVTIRTTSLTVGDSYPFSNYSGSATTKAGTFRVGTDVDGAIQSYCQGGAAEYYVDNISLKSLTLNQLITSINHTSTPDCYMSVKPTIATNFQAGIAFNIDDPNNPANFNLVYYNQNDGKVYWDRCVAGTYINQFNTTATYSAGKALVVRKIGTSVYVWYNDVYINSGTAVVTTGNYHGMFQTGSGATETKLDDWFCYGSGTNGEYSILNAFSN